MARILVPLPALDYDPTEAAVSWRVLTDQGHDVVFATPDGQPARADELMVTGEGLDPWGFVPGLRKLRLVGRLLAANATARAAYEAMLASDNHRHPRRWDALGAYDALLLPGGHRARGMRPYLESRELQAAVVDAFARALPVAAVCHGVLLAARSVDPRTGRSVLHGRKTTALTNGLERTALRVGRIVRFWDPGYYATYPETVQDEVTRYLASPADFLDAPEGLKTSGRARDTLENDAPAFVVRDANYVSARWPGDVHTFAKTFDAVLQSSARSSSDLRSAATPSTAATSAAATINAAPRT